MNTNILKGLMSLALDASIKGMNTSGAFVQFIFKANIKLLLTLVVLTVFFLQEGNAANKYSVATGNWNSTATWSLTSGGASGAPVPTVGDVVIIEGNKTVTINVNTEVLTSLTISSGSTLTTTAGYNVYATTITVNGTYIDGSIGQITGTMTVNSGGTYEHSVNGYAIKAATWKTGSTCKVTGVTNFLPTGTNQTFYNFIWNSANTTAFSISPTAINGDFNVTAGGSATLRINTSPYTIVGNLNLSGTSNFQIATGTTAKTLNVNGNFSMSNGTCTFSNGSGIGTLNVKGNYSHTGGTITQTSTGSGAIVFNGNTTQTFTSGGTVSNTINYTVNSGSTLQIADGSAVSGAAFTLSSGATLGIKSAAGITSAGATGNIQTTTRSFSTGSNYTYNGTSAQLTGSGLPATLNNLTINNSAGVTASSNYTVNGILYLQSANASATQGCLEMSTYTLTMGASATTTGTGDLTGTVKRTSFVVNTPYSFGNQFTTMNFPAGGTLPSDVTYIIRIGASPTWKTGAIQRTYDIFRTGGDASTLVTFNLHYLDSELNLNPANDLVVWDYHSTISRVEEHGKSNGNTTDKWVGVSNRRINYFATVANDHLWTLSKSESPYFTWLGAQDTDWNNLNNWSTGIIPTDTSNVVIPDASTTVYDPTLPASTSIKTMTINTGGILNSSSGNTLTIAGSVGAWYNLGTYNAGTSTIVFTNANATMSDPTNFYNVTIADGAKLTLGLDNVMRIAGALSLSTTGVLNAAINRNTVEYNGTNQSVILPNGSTSGYYNLVLSGSGTKTLPASTLNLYGDFSLSGTAVATAQGIINTYGSFTVGSGTSFTTGAYSHTIGGNFSNNGTFTSTGSTITMNGSSAQTISGASSTFHHLTISNPASVTLGANTVIDGDLNVTSGNVFDLGAYTFNRSTTGGTMTIDGKMRLGGNSDGQTGSNFPLNFSTVYVSNSEVEYYGSIQTVYSGVTYNKLSFSGSGSISLPGSDITVSEFTVNKNNEISLSGNMAISKNLYLTNGLIILGSKNLTLGPSATIVGTPSATNMIVATGTGELRKEFTGTGSFTYPVGSNTGTAEYSPVSLNFTSGTFSSAYAGVTVTKSKHPGNTSTMNYLNRYWTVTPSGISGFSSAIVLQYLPADVVGNGVDIWNGIYNGSSWTLLSAANTETNELTGTVTSFGAFTGGEQGVLPVSLSSLTSAVNGRNIKLSWTTLTEHNNAGFEIQRAEVRSSNLEYKNAGFINGKGTINTEANYSFEDRNLNTGKYKYRLKQIDINGNFEYHNFNGEVEVGVPGKYDLGQNYPNPFNPVTKINFDLPYDSKVKMIIYDVTGREIKTLVNEVRTAGYHTIVCDASMISSGIYFYRIIANANGKDYINTKKLALVK